MIRETLQLPILNILYIFTCLGVRIPCQDRMNEKSISKKLMDTITASIVMPIANRVLILYITLPIPPAPTMVIGIRRCTEGAKDAQKQKE